MFSSYRQTMYLGVLWSLHPHYLYLLLLCLQRYNVTYFILPWCLFKTLQGCTIGKFLKWMTLLGYDMKIMWVLTNTVTSIVKGELFNHIWHFECCWGRNIKDLIMWLKRSRKEILSCVAIKSAYCRWLVMIILSPNLFQDVSILSMQLKNGNTAI